MKNLVTKLSEVIENPMLPKIDEIVLSTSKISSSYSSSFELILSTFTSQQFTIEIVGNGYFSQTYDGLSDVSQRMTKGTFQGTNGNQLFYFSNGNYAIKINNKNNITRVRLQKYGSRVEPSVIDADIRDFKYMQCLQFLNLDRTNSTGNIADCPNNNFIQQFSAQNKFIKGNLKDLGAMTLLTYVTIADSSVTGDIIDLADAQIANGRTSGTLEVVGNGIITHDGNVVENNSSKTITFSSGSYFVS